MFGSTTAAMSYSALPHQSALLYTDPAGKTGAAPLQHVHANARVLDTAVRVDITQTFVNPCEHPIDAKYIFPLYEGAAVCAFEAEIDGKRILGKLQEKEEALKTYDEAVKQGKLATLLEQHSADVFQTSVGNIPPEKTVLIKLTYVSEIKDDAEPDQIRLVIPTSIAPRYSPTPQQVGAPFGPLQPSNFGLFGPTSRKSYITRPPGQSIFSLEVACAMTKPIISVQSPSHFVEVMLAETEPFDPSTARVTLVSDEFLDKDFVLIIRGRELDHPRCIAERNPDSSDPTTAMMLTMCPRFALPDLPTTELVFLVDRSGSMQGAQMEQAKQALQLFLKSIPVGHYFDIVSFGSRYTRLFGTSAEYTASTLAAAEQHVASLSADMDGTEIAAALEEVFRTRRGNGVSMQVFLLTDGGVTNVDAVINIVRRAVKDGLSGDGKSFVRVFSLGVGNAVSHHLVEGVARAGEGLAQFVLENERMEVY
ncbi:hypothetical protein HK104_002099 [Borealophlyctis nickersoniae]|nr:hypothetical protein HK104_002099 [Borealophlyctis nickersoniae]